VPNPILQEFIAGSEITTDLICDVNGDVLGIVSRKRIEVKSGEVLKGVTIYDRRIVDACLLIAKELPVIGPITIQCINCENKLYFTEINARLGGGIPLSIAAGANSPQWLLARAANIAIDIPAIGSYQTGLYLTRYNESFFLSEEQRAQVASHHL
jgi:carbamoyl-phosphate synthase large subunit